MFNGKKIKELEKRVDTLEVEVRELTHLVGKYCHEVDYLLEVYNKKVEMETGEAPTKPTPKPRRRPRKKNGKENPKATE